MMRAKWALQALPYPDCFMFRRRLCQKLYASHVYRGSSKLWYATHDWFLCALWPNGDKRV